jgi:transposase
VKVAPERLVFVDEFGTNLGMTRSFARAPRGVRARGAVPFNPDPNITLTVGLRLDGFVAPFAFEDATNGEAFRFYTTHQLAPELHAGDVVVLDNLSAHKVAGVREAIEHVGARLMYLPPYSPDLSPVESCGSKIKQEIRAEAPRTPAAVYRAMGHALGSVTSHDAHGWFGRCGYRTKPDRAPP